MSFLSTLSPSQIVHEPFPHIVVENALPEPLCRQLTQDFPPLNVFTKGQPYRDNQKLYYHALPALTENHLSPSWKSLMADFLHPQTWSEICRLFQPAILNAYPDFESRFGKPDQLRSGVRLREGFTTCDLLLDSMLLIHTPITGSPCIERGPHLKLFDTLYLGYLFLRSEDDQAEGGDLEFFSVKPGATVCLNQRKTVDREILKLEKVIPYRVNTLVLFLNTPRSIQGLSARTASRFPVMNFHFNAHFRKPLFHVKDKPGTVVKDFLERNTRRVISFFSNT
ncbi:MAG: hypothetical protein HY774_27270 [Acidobacteria bacterium]|nr:hypothetical protein [Acidobacteriota bacterium]